MEDSEALKKSNVTVSSVNVKMEASQTPRHVNVNAGLNIKEETVENSEILTEGNANSCMNIKMEKLDGVIVKKESVENSVASIKGSVNSGVKIKIEPIEGVRVKQESAENSARESTIGNVDSGVNIKKEPVEGNEASTEGNVKSVVNIKKEKMENGELTTEGHVNSDVNIKTEKVKIKEEVCVTPSRDYSITDEEENTTRSETNDLTVIERENSTTPSGSCMLAENGRISQNEEVSSGNALELYSLEEGELTPSVLMTVDAVISVEPKRQRRPSKRLNYSSFIETSKEEGECSTTFMTDTSVEDVEVTIIENLDKETGSNCSIAHQNVVSNDIVTMELCSVTIDIEECTEIYIGTKPFEDSKTALGSNASISETDQTLNCKHENGAADCTLCVNGNKPDKKTSRKRELSSQSYYENTPKRPHLFEPEDSEKHVLSPIQKVSHEISQDVKLSDIETPLIASKFQVSNKDICSTPMSKSEASTESDSMLCTKGMQHKYGSASVFSGIDDKPSSIQPDDLDKLMTVDELIADITDLCESINASLEGSACENELGINDEDLRDTFTSGDEKENDKTLTEETETVNNVSEVAPGRGCADIEDIDISDIINEITMHSNAGAEPVNESEKSTGRFKDLHVVSKTDLTVAEEDKKLIDKDANDFDTDDDDCVIDILCLEKYDEEEADVDQTVLEKSHFAAAVERSISVEQVCVAGTDALKTQLKTDAKVEEKVADSVALSKDDNKKSEKVKDEIDNSAKPTDTAVIKPICEPKGTLPDGFVLSEYDVNKFRKSVESFAEVEACRRWGTSKIGTPRADVNLTVATTFHINKVSEGKVRSSGYLECDSMCCAYLCDDEKSCKLNKLSCTSNDKKYMDVDTILRRLENQKQLLVDMRHKSLVQLKGEMESKKSSMRKSQVNAFNNLMQRQRRQLDEFMFQTRTSTDRKIPKELQLLRSNHLMETTELKKLHHNQFSYLSAEGKESLNKVVTRYDFQAEPIDEIMEQLNFNYHQYYREGLSNRYGPPVRVNLRKGPCRDNNWTHSTVLVYIPAGIAQALTLEEDLYDHHYAW